MNEPNLKELLEKHEECCRILSSVLAEKEEEAELKSLGDLKVGEVYDEDLLFALCKQWPRFWGIMWDDNTVVTIKQYADDERWMVTAIYDRRK